jgi:hypothetical protein
VKCLALIAQNFIKFIYKTLHHKNVYVAMLSDTTWFWQVFNKLYYRMQYDAMCSGYDVLMSCLGFWPYSSSGTSVNKLTG